MKKILMIALLLAVTINAFSQRRRTVRRSYARSSQWYIMPKGGFNIADITDWGGDVRFGLALGGELGCRVNQLITLSGSFIYSQQGTTTWYNNEKNNLSVHLDYINLPFMVHFSVAPGLQLKVGLQPGILVNDNSILKIGGRRYEGSLGKVLENTSWDDAGTQPVDWSMPFAVSYQYRKWVFDARYNLGLNNVTYGTWTNSGHNSVFQFTVGYKFSL